MTAKKMWLAFLLTGMVAGSSVASEFRVVGVRAMSMGGAGVARPPAAYAVYYNPAVLGVTGGKNALETTVGISARDTGLAPHLNALMDYDWETAVDNPEGAEAAAIIAELGSINDTDGLMLLPQICATGLKIGNLGGAVIPIAQIAVYANLDTTHLNPTDPLDPNSFAYNATTLFVQGMGIVEVPIGYGREFKLANGSLSVGGAVKYIGGMTFDVQQGLYVTDDSDVIEDTINDADKTASGFGVDLGVLYRTANDRLSLGLLARNLNSPKFKTVTGDEFTEKMQLRGGAAYSINDQWYVAADVDLTANKTLIAGYKSRQIGGGICYQGGMISLRAGLSQDIEGDGAPLVWCAGLGIGGENLHLDLAGSFAGDMVKVDDVSIPPEGGVLLALGGAW